MSFANPTRLRLGMTAEFNGQSYRLVGRSVLGENEASGTYYWNEFNLETAAGEEATLVFDETERYTQWRLFTQFEPEYPLTAADAAEKQVGDRLNLTGEDVGVTFHGSSRVYHIEGKAPEGEGVGTVARYFNAESGNVMQVVSWTGEEVEYYDGKSLTPGLVASAFRLPQELGGVCGQMFSTLNDPGSGSYMSLAKFGALAAGLLVMVIVIFGFESSCQHNHGMAETVKLPAPPRPLELGATGTLFDKNYRVTGHAVVDVAEVGAHWERHEYELLDDAGAAALLVCGEQPGRTEWVCFEPLTPMLALTSAEAAAKKMGDSVVIDGFTGRVTSMFLATVEQVDGEGLGGLKPGTVFYGLRGVNESRLLLARWNQDGIQYFRGRALPAKKGASAFVMQK